MIGILLFWIVPFFISYYLIRYLYKSNDNYMWTNGRAIIFFMFSIIPVFNYLVICIALIVLLIDLGESGFFEKEPPSWL